MLNPKDSTGHPFYTNTIMDKSKNKTFNYQMCIFSAIAMMMVILGHIKNDSTAMATFCGWFPYYSVHLPMFLFVSGYFFRDSGYSKKAAVAGPSSSKWNFSDLLTEFLAFFIKKAKNLLLPYFIINGIYLLFNSLMVEWGFTYVKAFSLYEWLVRPWLRFYVIDLASPCWYLIAIFIAEIYFYILRKIFGLLIRLKMRRAEAFSEFLLLLLTLAAGIFIVYKINTGHVSECAQVYLRSVLMLFFMQLGVVYRKYLNILEKIPAVLYFAAIAALQFILIVILHNDPLDPWLYCITYFDDLGLNFFIAGSLGILLWLRISAIIASIPKKSRTLIFIGQNTKYIMAFHLSGFFMLNYIFYFLHSQGIGGDFLSAFNPSAFKGYLYYNCCTEVRMVIFYFAAGLLWAMLVSKLILMVKNMLARRQTVLPHTL